MPPSPGVITYNFFVFLSRMYISITVNSSLQHNRITHCNHNTKSKDVEIQLIQQAFINYLALKTRYKEST